MPKLIEVNRQSVEHGAGHAQITRIFTADNYIVEVSLPDETESSQGVSYQLFVATQEPMPRLGHQSDHMVRYALGDMPAEEPPGLIMGPFGQPSETIPAGIHAGAKQWDDEVGQAWPNVRFCMEDPPDNSGAATCPAGVDDGITVMVSTVPDGTCDGGNTDAFACMPVFGSNQHVHSTAIYFEHPTFKTVERQDGTRFKYPVRWVDIPRLGGTYIKIDMRKHYALYVRAVAMHEFGHAAGLADLQSVNYPGFLMAAAAQQTTVPSKDETYLEQVYRNEHGAAPHAENPNQ